MNAGTSTPHDHGRGFLVAIDEHELKMKRHSTRADSNGTPLDTGNSSDYVVTASFTKDS